MFDGARLELPRFKRQDQLVAMAEALSATGVVIIEDAAPAPLLKRVLDELDPWFERAFTGVGPFLGRRTKRFSGVFAKARSTAMLAADELVVSLAETVLKGDNPNFPRCDAIQLNLTQAVGIGPGEPAQVLHRDETMYPFERDFEVMVNVMWALDPWDPDMGATRFAPASMAWPRTRVPEPHEVVIAAAPVGAAIVWLGSTIHGGGANRTERLRRGLAFSYSLGWLGQSERLLLSTPPELARALPERLQRLIGYQLHKPNLGWIEERDPIEWLRGEITELAPAHDNLTPLQAALIEWRLAERPEGG